MLNARTPDDYGMPTGGFVDAFVVEDPTAEVASVYFNRQAVDVAAMTHTALRAWVAFTTTTTAATVTITPNDGGSCFADGTPGYPTSVQKTAQGTYVATFPAATTDDVNVSEPFIIRRAIAAIEGSTDGRARILSRTAQTVTIGVYDPTTNTLSDLGGTAVVYLEVA